MNASESLLEKMDKQKLVDFYSLMVKIRRFDEKRKELATEFPTPQQHPHFGQEAVTVGAVAALQPDDFVLGTHRPIAQAIVKGADLKCLTAELFGKKTGYAGGRAGEMAFQAADCNVLASGVVGNTVPIATGIGIASQLKGSGQVCLCFFGDGATSTGLFHEGVNLAAIWDAPVVFLCENNQFGLTTHISRVTRVKQLADKAAAYGIPGVVVDGMHVLTVYDAVSKAVKDARDEKGPTFIECMTYRFGGYNIYTDPHQGVGLYRTAEEVEKWKERCPIATFKAKLMDQGLLTEEEAEVIDAAVLQEIEEAFEFARRSPEPDPASVTEGMLSKGVSELAPPAVFPKTPERELSFRDAIKEAIREEMERDERVFIFGEEVGLKGGMFGVTRGFVDEFGEDRVRDTPISEGGIVGAAVGAALAGLRPIPEIMIVDFVGCGGAIAILFNELATIPYIGNGQFRLPVVLRMPCGSRWPMVCPGAHHNGCLEAWFTSMPCLKVAVPSTPFDAKGLMKAAIRDDGPVIFFEHKQMYVGRATQRYGSVADMYPGVLSYVPEEEYVIPLGVADVKRSGTDVTVVATMMMVHRALKVAHELEQEGISVEVVDPRTLVPFDKATVLESLTKTGRLVVATEDAWQNGSGAGIVGELIAEAFPLLKAPVKRVAALNVPVPYGQVLEGAVIPQEEDIIQAVKEVTG